MARAGILSMMVLVAAVPAMAQEHQHAAMDHSQMEHGALPPSEPPSEPPSDWAADAVYDPAAMAAARHRLFAGTSDHPAHLVLFEQLEWRPGAGSDGFSWDAKAWYGGDLDRIAIRSEGETDLDGATEQAEAQLLWSHAISPYFNLETGVRQDFQSGPSRSHAALGIAGTLPYWVELESALFLSHKGEATARLQLHHDMRLTQSLILQPGAEMNLSAQDMPGLGIGSGISDIELGLRLRYAVRPRFAPYLGVNWQRKLGGSARHARRAGEHASAAHLVAGVRFWF